MNACDTHAPRAGFGRYQAFAHCASLAHLQNVVQYLSTGRFWALQSAETLVFLALAAVPLGVLIVLSKRRHI
jgi:hypothetical protein